MEEDEYLSKRVDDQIDWYDKKSGYNKKLYKGLIVVQIVFSSSLPFLTTFSSSESKILIAVFGVALSLISGILGLYKFQENWITYRTTAETLKHEKYLYLTKTDYYHKNSDLSFNLLVNRIESIISKENSMWHQKLTKTEKEHNSKEK